MGTGGLVVFRSVTGGRKEIYLKARFHADGDYSSLGFKLHRFLSGVEFTNGLSGLDSLEAILMQPDLQAHFPADKVEEVREHRLQKMKAFKTVCNGFDCLVAQFVTHFKYGPGGLYILPLSSPLVCEFVYVIDYDADASAPLSVITWQGSAEDKAKTCSLAEFRSLCRGSPEDLEDEGEQPPLKMKKKTLKSQVTAPEGVAFKQQDASDS